MRRRGWGACRPPSLSLSLSLSCARTSGKASPDRIGIAISVSPRHRRRRSLVSSRFISFRRGLTVLSRDEELDLVSGPGRVRVHPYGSDVARAGGRGIAVGPLHLLQLCFSPRRVRARHPDHDQGQHQQRRGLYLDSPPLLHHLGRHFLGSCGARLFCRPTRLTAPLHKENARAGVLWKFGNRVLECLSQNIDFYFWRSIFFLVLGEPLSRKKWERA